MVFIVNDGSEFDAPLDKVISGAVFFSRGLNGQNKFDCY